MFEGQGRFSEKTIAKKIVKIDRTSAESGHYPLRGCKSLHIVKLTGSAQKQPMNFITLLHLAPSLLRYP